MILGDGDYLYFFKPLSECFPEMFPQSCGQHDITPQHKAYGKTPKWYLFIYLQLHAFKLLNWQELRQVPGAHSIMQG